MAKVKRYKNPDKTVRGNWHVLAFQRNIVIEHAKQNKLKLSEMVREMIMFYHSQHKLEK